MLSTRRANKKRLKQTQANKKRLKQPHEKLKDTGVAIIGITLVARHQLCLLTTS